VTPTSQARTFVRKREVVTTVVLLVPTFFTIAALERCRQVAEDDGGDRHHDRGLDGGGKGGGGSGAGKAAAGGEMAAGAGAAKHTSMAEQHVAAVGTGARPTLNPKP